IVMNPNERILGEGVSHPLAVQGFNSTINLPGTGEPGGVPVIDNITGVPVQLADNVEFGGFQITNTTNGPAIFADNINRATIRGVVIDTVVNGSGIVINDSSGTIAISNTEIRGADDDAFVISGGNATVRFT